VADNARSQRSAQEIGALFGAQVMGGVLVDAPAPGSRHALILESERRWREGELTTAQFDAYVARLMREAAAKARASGDAW
jgi:hypothetical protein